MVAVDQAANLREMMEKSRDVRVISVASGKGGVGKSSISVNLAIIMSRLGKRVLILDADFGLANIDIMLGITTRLDLRYVLSGEKSIQDIIQLGYEGVRFISGGSGVSELIDLDSERLDALLSNMINSATEPVSDAPVDVVIMDAGAGINNTVMQILLASSETIVVTTPEPTAFLDAYALVKTVVKHDATHPLHMLANKCEKTKEAQTILTGFVSACENHLGKEINPLGLISYNHNITTSIKRQVPLAVSDPHCATVREMEVIARAILDIPVEKRNAGMLSKIFARLLRAGA